MLTRNRQKRLPRLLFFSALLVLCHSSSRAQDKVRILSVSSQTADLVTFQISVPKGGYALSQDIVVNYIVKNNSTKVVYLVLEPKPRIATDADKHILTIESPVKYQNEYTQYDNDLIKIPPRRSFSGKLIINGAEVPRDKDSESEDWDFQVVFGYVLDPAPPDISELQACKDTKYSFSCLGKLREMTRQLAVGSLMVEVKNH